jgi:non-homologous end joining protein Ku
MKLKAWMALLLPNNLQLTIKSYLGKTLVENLSSKGFDISQYSDEYTKQLEQLINAKIAGKQTLNITEAGNGKEDDVSKNLLEALKASVKQKSKSKR